MFAILMLFTVVGTTRAGYAGSSSNDVGGGYGYGYSGSFSGTGGNPPAIPNIPNFEAFFDSFRKYQDQFFQTLQQQTQQIAGQQAAYAPGFSSYGAAGIPPAGHFAGGDGSAVASASLGPQGGYQTAAVYPENPNSPNIFSRFAETSQGGGGGGGSYGVFTSSVSSSSNVDGKPQNFHRASTTINDNGKITTYTVKNP